MPFITRDPSGDIVAVSTLPSHQGQEFLAADDPEIAPATLGDLQAIAISRVKAEAYRRIVAYVPEWRQRNLFAQGLLLVKLGVENWTPEQTAAWDAGAGIWVHVAAIRAASDANEALIGACASPEEIDALTYDWPETPG